MKTNRTVVLLGIGHTNAHIVRQWAIHPIPNCRLVCISNFPCATYSGMLPGRLAKQFAPSEMEIELAPLAQRAAAELILGDVVGLDVDKQELKFANREPLHYDTLSIGVGSMPDGWKDFDSPALVPIKPMQTFVDRLEKRLELCGPSARCVVVGGGVAGVEIALCLRARLSTPASPKSHSISIVTSGDEIAGGMCQRSQRSLSHLLIERSIEVVKRFRVTKVGESSIADAEGKCQAADVVIWATGAVPPPILTKLGLPTNERGFLTTTSTLLTTAGYPIFVVGDSGTIESDPAPKAGVT
ncbi:MAG: FAD-dependent oxidoreductase, partial [Planctomycetales bacterium]|nr:FAD-dependent oxidoreductase [Planctomycetales bacterium]